MTSLLDAMRKDAALQAAPTFRSRRWSLHASGQPTLADQHLDVAQAEGNTGTQQVRRALQESGQPLDAPTEALMAARLGHRFASVRIHAGERAAVSADAMQAHAFTAGNHIVFARGRYQPGSQAGRQLLAHELAHVVQGGGGAGEGVRVRQLDESAQRETEAARAAQAVGRGDPFIVRASQSQLWAANTGSHGGVQRSPDSQIAGLNMTFDENGRVTLLASGPNLPAVGSVGIGVRRNSNGTYQLVVGGQGTVVAPSEIPGSLRNAVDSLQPAQGRSEPSWRLPTCEMLRAPDGMRLMTFDEYRVSQMLWPDLLPMTRSLYSALIAACPVTPKEAEPPAGPGDFPERTLPAGMEMA